MKCIKFVAVSEKLKLKQYTLPKATDALALNYPFSQLFSHKVFQV